MLVMMTATWCGWCKKLEADTLDDPWVRHFLAGFVLVKAFQDKDVDQKYGCGYPTLVFTDDAGELAHKTAGYKLPMPFAAECARAFKKLALAPRPELKTLLDKKLVTAD